MQVGSEGSVPVKWTVVMCLCVRDPACNATKSPLDAALHKWLSARDPYAYAAVQINLSLSFKLWFKSRCGSTILII